MYVLVQHYISDPRTFWSDVSAALSSLPSNLSLHHCFPTPDGSHAVCVWHADAVRDVRAFIEAYVGHVSRNVYFPVENPEGIATPTDIGGKPSLED
jgi:hypothetical protein